MNIKEIKNKINILININKLTNTMSMISFSKMKKVNNKCFFLNKLYLETKKIFFEINLLKNNNIFCYIIITTNKGFCGNINNDLIKYFLFFLKNNKKNDILIIGKKGIEFFKKKNLFIKKKIVFNDKNIYLEKKILQKLILYENVFFISNKIINNNIKIIKTNLYEIYKKNFYELKKINKINLQYIYINYTLKFLYYENYFAELKIRMMIMKSAFDNSKKIIKNMNTIKNKIRQFKVTQEMLEIINSVKL